ncbi:hypothetical protein B0H13DRAFT_2260964 [Mycena leptocephala]|nr:hypothetical protein B0H13DRAFT_2260964 [Mycena leptocephala]
MKWLAALRTPSKKHRKLIPRPEGQSGRADGYNLQEAMGLKRQKDRFCRLSRISRSYMFKYLNPHKTIQKQDPTRVDKVIKLTWYCVTYRSISRFQGGWPIRDLMKKMLQNSVNSLKADRRAEEDSNSEEQVVAAPKKKSAGGKSSKSQSDSESDDDEELDWINDEGDSDLDDEGSDDQVVVKRSDSRKSQSNRGTKRAVSPNHEDEDEPSKKKKKASRPSQLIKNNSPADRTGIKVQITKRKQNSAKGKWIIVIGSLVLIRVQHKSSSNQDEERPKKRAKFTTEIASPPVRRAVKLDRPTHFQIPQQCLKSGCNESVPASPSDDLSQLFKEHSELISSADYQQFQLDAIVQDICAHISHENDVLRLETLDNDTLDNSIAWFNFLESINGKIHEFSKYGPKKFTNAARHARCGYFGPQGSAVIVSTICRIFTGVFSHIRRHLSEVIRDQITASPNSFDSETRKSPPAEIFPLDMFFEFVWFHISCRINPPRLSRVIIRRILKHPVTALAVPTESHIGPSMRKQAFHQQGRAPSAFGAPRVRKGLQTFAEDVVRARKCLETPMVVNRQWLRLHHNAQALVRLRFLISRPFDPFSSILVAGVGECMIMRAAVDDMVQRGAGLVPARWMDAFGHLRISFSGKAFGSKHRQMNTHFPHFELGPALSKIATEGSRGLRTYVVSG